METENTLKIAICEDTRIHIEYLVNHIKKSGIPSEVSCFENSEDFLQTFQINKYDIIFMDIYMDGEAAGVKAAEMIREQDKTVTLAFTTTSLEHTLESYRLKAIMYLEKPVKESDVKELLELALIKRKTREVIEISLEGGKKEEILLEDISFFEQKGNTIEVVTVATGIKRTSRSVKLDDLEKKLPKPPFLRCHRSFIINLNQVRNIDKETHSFTMQHGGRADINQRRKLKEFEDTLQLWMIEKAGREA